MYQVSFYVPEEFAAKVKEAMFKAGAGRIGNYARCSFEIKGLGQFEPLSGSQPFLGKVNEVEKVPEIKVEMVCRKEIIKDVVAALKATHPYETPAYYVTETLGF